MVGEGEGGKWGWAAKSALTQHQRCLAGPPGKLTQPRAAMCRWQTEVLMMAETDDGSSRSRQCSGWWVLPQAIHMIHDIDATSPSSAAPPFPPIITWACVQMRSEQWAGDKAG